MPPVASEVAQGSGILQQRQIMVTLAGLLIVLLTLIFGRVNATIILITSANESLPFPDAEATFGPQIPNSGMSGILFTAIPSNACEPLQNIYHANSPVNGFLLVERGLCNFVTKVQHAQEAGYAAAIVYNNEDSNDLITMSGSGSGIQIPAVFVSKQAGEVLKQFNGDVTARCYMFPSFENTAWSIMAVSFLSLLAVSAVLLTFFLVRRHRLRRNGSRLLSREPVGMSPGEVRSLPVIMYSGSANVTAETCAICLEEYAIGEKLRILPCHHEFHVACIDQWLITQRPFCPICKQDAHSKNGDVLPTEQTPLLSSLRRHLGSNVTTIPVATQTSPIVSPLQSPSNISSSFFMSPHALTASCPIPLYSRNQDEIPLSRPHARASGLCSMCVSAIISRGNTENDSTPTGHGSDLC
eukprot:c23583_g1_i1 orf=301-1536(+)